MPQARKPRLSSVSQHLADVSVRFLLQPATVLESLRQNVDPDVHHAASLLERLALRCDDFIQVLSLSATFWEL